MSSSLIKLQTVYCRGVNFFGQLGLNNGYKSAEFFTAVPGLERVDSRSVHASYAQSLCLLNNGELLIWGWPLDVRSQMQLIMNLNVNPRMLKFIQRYSPLPWISMREGKDFPQKEAPVDSGYEEISIGGAFVVARDAEGRAYVWGNNHRGQCGTDDYAYRAKPTIATDLLDRFIVKVAAGYQHSLFVSHDGYVFGTGRIGNYAFGRVPLELVTYKACIKRICQVRVEGIVDVAAGQNHTLFLNENGKVFAVGKNEYGQCSEVSLKKYVEKPQEVFIPEKSKMIACGTKHSLVLGESGVVYGFGAKMHGQIDGHRDGYEIEQGAALPIEIPSQSRVKRIYAAFDRSAAIMENGEVWVWGGLDYRYLEGEFYEEMTLVNPLLPKKKDADIEDVGLGYMHTLLMTSFSST